jgi:hypothetical protein
MPCRRFFILWYVYEDMQVVDRLRLTAGSGIETIAAKVA